MSAVPLAPLPPFEPAAHRVTRSRIICQQIGKSTPKRPRQVETANLPLAVLCVEVATKGIEIHAEAVLARRIGGLLDHGLEDGFEEAGVFGQGDAVAGGEGRLDGLSGGGRYKFEAADEDTGGLS